MLPVSTDLAEERVLPLVKGGRAELPLVRERLLFLRMLGWLAVALLAGLALSGMLAAQSLMPEEKSLPSAVESLRKNNRELFRRE
jgi:hypothetical protein